MKCIHCGREIENALNYCGYCGTKAVHVPPIFTMAKIGTNAATEAIRSYSEWGFYNSPDAELDPETGKKPEYDFNALDELPSDDPIKWAREFVEADQIEAEQLHQEDAEWDDEEEEDDEEEDAKATDRAPKKKVPSAVIVILLVLLGAAIAVAAYFLFGGDKTYEVDLNSIMNEPKVIGYDGYGEMALMPQIDNAKEDAWLDTVEFDVDKEAFAKVLDTVKYTPDKTEDLSNGDVVNITIEYDKNLAAEAELKIIAKPATYEVKGLEIGKDLAYDPNAYHAYYDDFILPQSDREELSRADVVYSTNGNPDTVQQAINEIYARHGWIFGSEYYDKLFRGFKWYTPMYEPEKFDNAWLNEYEKANLDLLTGYRNELKAAEKKAAEEAAKKAAEEKAAKEAAEKAAQSSKPAKPSDDD
ncbi:MAG: YARHG domain-containing protein [Clostridiales bacterium]|nr:YARHG domain-containing protein [Clostridiales bacterium]